MNPLGLLLVAAGIGGLIWYAESESTDEPQSEPNSGGNEPPDFQITDFEYPIQMSPNLPTLSPVERMNQIKARVRQQGTVWR